MTSTPLSDPACLYALDRAFGNPVLTARIAARWSTWEELASASIADLARVTGGRGLSVGDCPALPQLPGDCDVVGRFAASYPAHARPVESAPSVLFVTGQLPTGPALTVAGATHPSPPGYRAARRAAELAHARGATVVAVVTNGCGDAAIDAALNKGGAVVAVVPYGVNRMQATNRRLIDEVVRCGGAVVSAADPDQPRTDATATQANRLAVALAPALFLAEAGLNSGGGLDAAVAALENRRYLVVSDHHDPRLADLSSLGSLALSRTDPVTVLGESAHLRERVAAGKTPADAVVTCDADLDAAIAYGCGISDRQPPQRDQSGWISLG